MASLTQWARASAARLVERAGFSPAPGTGVANWLYGGGVALPHEPFAGAWQRGLDEAAGAGPNILAYSAVYSCVNIISSDIARMPLRVLQRNSNGSRDEHRKHPAWRLLRHPNEYQTSLQFIQQYLTSKLINGNTYVYLVRDARGVVESMYVLNPNAVRPLIGEDGSIFYELGQDVLAGLPGQLIVTARNVLHDRAATYWHPLVGVSPLFAAGISAMTGARILVNSEKFFANMSRAGGVLTAPGKIDKDVAKKIQTEWEANYGPRGMGRTAVLSNGLEFKGLTMNAVDSELVSQLRWTVEDIARVYRVPGFKLGDLNKVSYRNSEQMARDYFQGCLSYHIEAFEQCFEKALEMADGVDVEFDLRPLFRMETDTRYETYSKALNAGFMSINEVRREEDLPPVKGGDEPRVQMQYVPLSQVDALAIAGAGTKKLPAPKDPQDTDEEEDSDSDSSKGTGKLTDQQLKSAADAFMRRLTLGASDGA